MSKQEPLIPPEMPLFDASARPNSIPTKPDFADNRDVALAAALKSHLQWLRETYAKPIEMAIATGYFNPEGYGLIADELERLAGVRLLLGAEPIPPPAKPMRMPGDPLGDGFEKKLVGEALKEHTQGLERDRNLLDFSPETDRTIQRLLAFVSSGKLQVRRYEKAFLHGKAFIFAGDEGVLAGSSNFTAAGLVSNLELDLGRYDPEPVSRVRNWFESLWAEAVPYDLSAIYRPRVEAVPPYLVYLRVLWERYKDELEDEAGENQRIRLTTFQNDGIYRAKRIAQKYNGVLIADGVGLGKTFIGGELLRQVVEDRRQRALLIAPAALRDSTWQRFADTHQLFLEKISYEQLADEKQLGGSGEYLKMRPNDYQLVVVDEAQAFRNPSTRRAQALRALLQGTPPKTLVLMSATPVNNSLWDLYYLLSYFVSNDAAFSDLGIRSLRDHFGKAMRIEPDALTPDILFDILDAVTVRRTRHFVRRYYPGDKVIGAGGQEISVTFPEPHVRAVRYSFDNALPGFFDEIEEALAPENEEPKLTLARYSPSSYLKGEESDLRELALVGLIRSGLLKRFESSAHAFAETAEKMVSAHDAFLEGLARGVVLSPRALEEWEQTDSDEALDELIETSGSVPADSYDLGRLRADVKADRDLLKSFAARARSITPEKDPKLAQLVEELTAILAQANREGLTEKERRDKRKVLIFSYFADTVSWIYRYLFDQLGKDARLAKYVGRLAGVMGDDTLGGVSRERAIFGFAPESTEAPANRDEDLFDILVTTDVLAEGMNLQQCRHVINFDLPWNPMRLVQRHGRIDRIGSPHRDVYVRCFFPDKRLEQLLELERRIRRKLAQAAASVGLEVEVIPGSATADVFFADTWDEIGRLRREQPDIFVNRGEDVSAHSGEEYRQELRKALVEYDARIKSLPWGAGSGFRNGERKGHFFCARVGEKEKSKLFVRFVPWGGSEMVNDTLACLRLITCTETTLLDLPKELHDSAYGAWQKARRDIFEEWTRATDPANLQPKVRPSLKAAANHLRRNPPSGMSQERIDEIIESIEAPLGNRYEREVREAMQSAKGKAASVAIVEAVKRLGLTPFKAPEPWPPIEEQDIRLICWMAVDTGAPV